MLSLVATPIGNLQDITLRALEVLHSADLIACEDTRTSRVLLDRHGIAKPLIAFHAFNEERAVNRLRELLGDGKHVAIISDAGTPGIADPGYAVVQLAIDLGIEPQVIPGPAAFVMAAVLSGLPLHSFVFRGFPPPKSGARRRFFAQDAALPYTLVYYESTHRIIRSLADARDVFGDRRCAVSKELTKKFEQTFRGTFTAVIAQLEQAKILGEWVMVVDRCPKGTVPEPLFEGGDAETETDQPHENDPS